jgi:hypothetical protein
MGNLHLPPPLWLLFYGYVVAIPILLLVAYWLANSGWFVLCRFLQHRGWDISAEEPPAPTNL